MENNMTAKVLKKFPTLYDKTKTGKIKIWNVRVESLWNEVAVVISHGEKGGKQTISSKDITQGKNIGKSNETTITQQAILEAGARWKKKVDAGMVDNESKIGKKINYFPMLAVTAFSPISPDVVNGTKKITTLPTIVLLQKKLNGVRCLAVKKRNVVKLYSRRGKEYTHITDVLTQHLNHKMMNGGIWDGEIYVHGWSLERIAQAVKRDKSKVWRKKVLYHVKKREWEEARWWVKTRNDTQRLEYHRYDCPSVTHKAHYRIATMALLPTSDLIKQVQTVEVNGDWDILRFWHDKWVREGYEGLIIRDPNEAYLWNHRDKRLLKYKEFFDEEFEIIGYHEGTGSNKGCVTWECRGDDGFGGYVHFGCKPRGTTEYRKRMFRLGRSYIGKMLTVRFQERSMDGVPLFPVGITIRDYE
jgi:DNA ligase-1